MGTTSVDDDVLWRAGELKDRLFAFASRTPRISRHLARHLSDAASADEAAQINAIDRFLLQSRLTDGRTVVEHFCGSNRDLSDSDRSILLGWRDVVEGVFEITEHDGASLQAVNLIDELAYRVVSNMGPAGIAAMTPGDFVSTRLARLGEAWMLTGASVLFPADAKQDVLRAAASLALQQPDLAFNNPDKLARAWQLQDQERDYFIEYFGADLVIVAGAQAQQRWAAFWRWRLSQSPRQAQASAGVAPTELPDELISADTVAFIYDEHEGLTLLAEYGLVQAAFADPDRALDRTCRQTVLGYLRDESVSTLPFRRLADTNPDSASKLFARLLNKPRFRWSRDGEALLRRYKPDCFNRPVRPKIVPLGETLATATRAA